MALQDKLTQHVEKNSYMHDIVVEQNEANSTITTEVSISVTDVKTLKQQRVLWL